LVPLRPMTWSTSNSAALGVACNTDTGVGTFTAGGQQADVTLTLTYNGGSINYDVEITPPTGFVWVQKPGTGVKHQPNVPSIAFRADVYYRPTDVSFHFIKAGEGTCPADMEGYFDVFYPSPPGKDHQANVTPVPMTLGNITSGCRWDNTNGDTIASYLPSWGVDNIDPKDGWLIWNVPQRWTLDNGTTWHEFGEARQRHSIDENGTMTVEKAGAGPFSKAIGDSDGDPNWNYSW
jgi:hypothetical protein